MSKKSYLALKTSSGGRAEVSIRSSNRAQNDNKHIVRNSSRSKRLFDVVFATCALVAFAPLIGLVALIIKITDGGPAIFSQERRGLNGELFRCYKLRSMVPDAGEKLKQLLATDEDARQEWNLTQKLQDDPRITAVGKFIRKTSLDELPQLINIIRGDMSIVGPRPIVQNEVAKYGAKIAAYDSVLPGLTGLWQISGRSDVSYDERVELDVQYASERSFWGDVRIVVLTIPAVLFSKGAV